MRSLLPYLVAGIVTGSLYGMAGLGLVLAYRTSGVFNFGHGAVAAGAAFSFYSLHYTHGWPWPLAAVLTILAFAAVVGWVMERVTRGLGDVPEAVGILTTVGILLAVEGLLFLLYGNSTRPFPEFLPTSGFSLGGVKVSWAQTISVVIATSSAVALYLFLQFSRLGVAMRAVVDNQTLTSLCGKKPLRISQSAWAISCGFAAVSGILLAPTLSLDANLLTLLVIQAFGACAVGLFSSLPLTYLGGIGLGIAASLATRFFTDRPWNGISPTVPFLILVAVLVCVPARRFPSRRASLRSLVPEITPMARQKVLKALRDRSGIPLKRLDADARKAALKVLRRFSPIRHLMSRHTRSLLRTYHKLGRLKTPIATRTVSDVAVEMTPQERELYDAVSVGTPVTIRP